MKTVSLRNERGRVISRHMRIARSFPQRSKGFLGTDRPAGDEALLIDPCGSIHTFGMRFTIDAIFLDRHNRVLRVCKALRPGRIAFGGWRARKTIECSTGALVLPDVGEVLDF